MNLLQGTITGGVFEAERVRIPGFDGAPGRTGHTGLPGRGCARRRDGRDRRPCLFDGTAGRCLHGHRAGRRRAGRDQGGQGFFPRRSAHPSRPMCPAGILPPVRRRNRPAHRPLKDRHDPPRPAAICPTTPRSLIHGHLLHLKSGKSDADRAEDDRQGPHHGRNDPARHRDARRRRGGRAERKVPTG